MFDYLRFLKAENERIKQDRDAYARELEDMETCVTFLGHDPVECGSCRRRTVLPTPRGHVCARCGHDDDGC